MKFGLRNIKTLVRSVGNPEKQFPSIHIAGTNGKGSTAAFVASIFREAKYRTALYTSPHLVRFTERIRINGQEISETKLVEYAQRLRPMIEKLNATFFEATTCIAFLYFAEEGVDVAIVETGLGGRLDSTNVLRPLVSVITNVSFDHMQYLGNTLSKIAREKAGIMKRGTPCITSSTNPDVVSTLRRIAKHKGTKLVHANEIVSLNVVGSVGGRLVVTLRSGRYHVKSVRLGLSGIHQTVNATTALTAIEMLMKKQLSRDRFVNLRRQAVRSGLERVCRNTGIRGRLETMWGKFILDVAHNPEGLRTLAASLPEQLRKNLVVIFGVMKDKDIEPMLDSLRSIGSHVVAVQPKTTRALPSKEIALQLHRSGIPASDGGSVSRGISTAKRLSKRKGRILITGSHYVVGEALSILESQRRRHAGLRS
jgi:dihydrofolate synthase/folylpolyglutamate synthase